MTSEQRQINNLFSKANSDDEALIMGIGTQSQSDISALIEPYRWELHLHCYRLLGSLHDAEDMVQETMLRAWRHFDTFKGSASLRTWLYTIATNASLDALKKRSPRTLPILSSPASDPMEPVAPRSAETLWLEPFPDSWLASAQEQAENPEARYTRSESVSLAFLTALQVLPPRQRAILLLSDVLDWRAVEIARLLELSVSAVNSALHRARLTLAKNYHNSQREAVRVHQADAETNALLSRYMQAWETDDVAGIVALLKEDATLSMPPVPSWYQGREAIRAFLLPRFGVRNQWRMCPTQANAQPACILYRANEAENLYEAFGIHVITFDGSQLPRQIVEVTIFRSPSLVTSFGFPLRLPQ
jgi:RNA polymerase sigma-70 factor (ECF subfamily)